MAKTVTLKSVQTQVRAGLAAVALAIASIAGTYVVREIAKAEERVERRATICASDRALAEATERALVRIFAPADPTPAQAVQIEEARQKYRDEVEPALANCGQRN